MTTNRLGKTSPMKIGFTSRALSFAALTFVVLALPGCQSVTGSPNVAEIRIVDTSPDAPGLDIYQGTNILAYNLGLGTITTYVQTTPGTYGFLADSAGTKQQLVSAQGTLLNGSQYTILIGNYLNSLQEIVLKDQSTPAPTGQMNVRFLDQSTTTGAIDLYLVPSGSTLLTVKPIITNITFNVNTGWNLHVGRPAHGNSPHRYHDEPLHRRLGYVFQRLCADVHPRQSAGHHHARSSGDHRRRLRLSQRHELSPRKRHAS